jgi:transposase-like protein
MTRKVNRVLWDQWRQRVKRQRESGLSIAEFCRREKVSPHSFHVWKRKLRQPGSVRGTSRSAAAAKRSGKRRATVTPRQGRRHAVAGPVVPSGSPGFLELPVAAVWPSPFIEVALADGTVIRVPQQNVAALVAMLRVLRGDRGELPGEEGCHA